jgi:hypothetical protein
VEVQIGVLEALGCGVTDPVISVECEPDGLEDFGGY